MLLHQLLRQVPILAYPFCTEPANSETLQPRSTSPGRFSRLSVLLPFLYNQQFSTHQFGLLITQKHVSVKAVLDSFSVPLNYYTGDGYRTNVCRICGRELGSNRRNAYNTFKFCSRERRPCLPSYRFRHIDKYYNFNPYI